MEAEWAGVSRYLDYSLTRPVRGKALSPGELPGDWGIVRSGLVYLCTQDEWMNRQIWLILRPGDILSARLAERAGGYYLVKRSAEIAWFGEAALGRLASPAPEWVRQVREAPALQLLESQRLLRRSGLRARLCAWLEGDAARSGAAVPLSDLADYLGADRSAMMKEIARMKREGLIAGEGARLRLQ